MSVAIGLTIEVIISTRETDMFGQIMPPRQQAAHRHRTNIAVYIEFDIAIVGPYDGINRIRKVLEKKPEA